MFEDGLSESRAGGRPPWSRDAAGGCNKVHPHTFQRLMMMGDNTSLSVSQDDIGKEVSAQAA